MKRPQTKQQRASEREKRKARYGRYWDEIRQRVYQRDHFTCRACGKAPPAIKKLNAHHVLLLRVSQTNDTRNLITLCDECHRILENKGLAILKRGGHRFEVVRMTFRHLAECKIKRQEALMEELNGKQPVPGDTRQDSKDPVDHATDSLNDSAEANDNTIRSGQNLPSDLPKLQARSATVDFRFEF